MKSFAAWLAEIRLEVCDVDELTDGRLARIGARLVMFGRGILRETEG